MALTTRRYDFTGVNLGDVQDATDPTAASSTGATVKVDVTFDDAIATAAAVDERMALLGAVPEAVPTAGLPFITTNAAFFPLTSEISEAAVTGDLRVKAFGEMAFRRGLVDQMLLADGALRPSAALASTLLLGVDARRWGSFYKGAGEFGFITATHAVSAVLATTEQYSVWDGVTLTATLPPNPDNGCTHEIKNLNATALTVAASAGDTLQGAAALAITVGAKYVFRKSDRVWFGFSAA